MERIEGDFTKNGFTLIRIIAASLVILTHSYVVLGLNDGDFMERHHFVGFSKLGVDTFFVISGYLVTLSAYRQPSLFQFAMSRVIRIVPGLAVVTMLTVFLLGPLLTSSNGYFSQADTWTYLGHMLVFSQQKNLPGVFTQNPVQAVNASLWTLGIEGLCYIALMSLIWAGSLRTRMLFLIAGMMLALHLNDTFRMDKYFLGIFQLRLNECGMLFFYGAFMASMGNKLPTSLPFAIASIGLIYLGFAYSQKDWHYSALIYLTLWPYALITFATKLKSMAFLNRFDISYGTYIYGFIIQQCLVQWVPHISVGILIIVSLLMSYAAGTLSWFLIEKPAMRLKGILFAPMGKSKPDTHQVTSQATP